MFSKSEWKLKKIKRFTWISFFIIDNHKKYSPVYTSYLVEKHLVEEANCKDRKNMYLEKTQWWEMLVYGRINYSPLRKYKYTTK